jgi:hypothetical protein
MKRNSAKIIRVGGLAAWLSAYLREELPVLRAHGLSMTRSFFYWPDFMPRRAGSTRR